MENKYINLKLKDFQIRHHYHFDILKLYPVAICQDKTKYRSVEKFLIMYVCLRMFNATLLVIIKKKLEITLMSTNKDLNNVPLLDDIIQIL